MRRLAIVLVALLLSLAPCPIAAAQLGPTAPSPLTENEPPPPANTNADDDGGLSTLQLVLIFGSAMAVLAAIAWIILRDAHRAAPVQERPHAPTDRLSARERERQQHQRRDKAKAARRQRKRNRPR